jgi:hypothetical protein
LKVAFRICEKRTLMRDKRKEGIMIEMPEIGLGVTGRIASYKAVEVMGLKQKQGREGQKI